MLRRVRRFHTLYLGLVIFDVDPLHESQGVITFGEQSTWPLTRPLCIARSGSRGNPTEAAVIIPRECSDVVAEPASFFLASCGGSSSARLVSGGTYKKRFGKVGRGGATAVLKIASPEKGSGSTPNLSAKLLIFIGELPEWQGIRLLTGSRRQAASVRITYSPLLAATRKPGARLQSETKAAQYRPRPLPSLSASGQAPRLSTGKRRVQFSPGTL